MLPLIDFVLLSYLPLAGMRTFSAPGFAVGCGQFLMVRRDAYRNTGGHARIRTTMHDGLMLPQLFRRHGLRTDIADLTHLATCRMYPTHPRLAGLAKNATEGWLRRRVSCHLLSCFSAVRYFPFSWPFRCAFSEAVQRPRTPLILAALAASFVPRLFSVWKYRQPLLSACLHPSASLYC